MKKIGIIAAEIQEMEAVKDKMKDIKEIQIYTNTFYEGKISNKECVLVRCGEGKVNAARTTQMLIDKFLIDAVINVGSAGGLNPELDYEDIVVLNNMDCLEDLYLDNNEIIDLKDLIIIKRLKKLSLINFKVLNDEQFIYMNEIESLRIDGSGIKDITPLLSMDKLKLLVIDEEQAIYNKKYINEFRDKGISVVDYMNRDVEVYYG